MVRLLKPYVDTNNMDAIYLNDNPGVHIAGYFLVDFFTKHCNYTRFPQGEKIIATYKIS